MKVTSKLYTFVGCATAVTYFARQSAAPDQATALAAAGELNSVSEALLAGVGNDIGEEEFKELLDGQITTVLEAIETLRGTSLHSHLDQTLNELLEYFYSAADDLMGGGGTPRVWTSGGVSSIFSLDE